ncbi:MAG: glycosyltransferase [Gammaproteobacteria bacterium]|nr:glycosyltransferase [Gammaproteobacteria bacterium]
MSTDLLIHLSTMEGGGAEKAVADIANGLTQRGKRIDLTLQKAQGVNLSRLNDTVAVHDLRCFHPLLTIRRMARLIDELRPLAVMATLMYPVIATALAVRLARHKPQFIIREANSVAFYEQESFHKKYLVRTLLAKSYYLADRIICVSDGVRAEVSERWPGIGIKAVTCRNPIDIQEIKALARQSVEHAWLRQKSGPVICAMGRLEPQKGFDLLIEALGWSTHPEIRLVILGEGQERRRLERLASKLGVRERVSLPGYRANPYPVISAADVFVMSSRFEGTANALIQALACNVPCISTDCPHGPREILQSGRFGQLVPPGDSKGLAQAIDLAVEGETQDTDEALVAFDLESSLACYEQVLNKA